MWPLLLGVEEEGVPSLTSEDLFPFLRISLMSNVGLLYHHREWDQVQRDIDRSLNNFTQGKRTRYRYEILLFCESANNISQRDAKRKELSLIINAALCRHQELHYYQGYHDVGTVFLLVAGEKQGFKLLERLSMGHIRFQIHLFLNQRRC